MDSITEIEGIWYLIYIAPWITTHQVKRFNLDVIMSHALPIWFQMTNTGELLLPQSHSSQLILVIMHVPSLTVEIYFQDSGTGSINTTSAKLTHYFPVTLTTMMTTLKTTKSWFSYSRINLGKLLEIQWYWKTKDMEDRTRHRKICSRHERLKKTVKDSNT